MEYSRTIEAFCMLQELVRKHWQWVATSYPGLGRITHPDDVRDFKLGHAMWHIVKAHGALAKELEPLGHGAALSGDGRKKVEEAIAKIFIGGLEIVEVLGLDAGILPALMEKIMKEQAQNLLRKEGEGSRA